MRKAIVKFDIKESAVFIKLDVTKLGEYSSVVLEPCGEIHRSDNPNLPWISPYVYIPSWAFTVVMEK